MRQVWIPRPGPPDVLELREAPDPSPAPGELRLRVQAAGVNFADILGRLGLYPDLPPMPVVVGYEVAGTVDAVGEGIDPAWVGAEVVAMTRFGGYADAVCAPQAQIFRRPSGMTAELGAALPVTYLTAWQLVCVMGSLRAGETVLVHSAGGGVGIAVLQLARHIGARVIGTASPNKHARLREMGFDHLIDSRAPDLVAQVRAHTAGTGVELALDPIGGRSWLSSYLCLAPTGRLGMYGISSVAGGSPSWTSRWLSNLRLVTGIPWFRLNPVALIGSNTGIFGANLGHMWNEVERMRPWMEDLLRLFQEGVVRPVVDRSFPLAQAGAAHQYIEDRRNLGKVLLIP